MMLAQGHPAQSNSLGAGLFYQQEHFETSLVVQWLRLHTPSAGGLGLIPGQGTRSCMPQLRARMLQRRPGAAK